MQKIHIVDGSSYIFRAFYAIRANLSNDQGMPTNALYGFVSMIRKLLEDEKPTHLVVVFDPFKKDSVNFRKELYPEYKANRSAMPEELSIQIPYFAKILDALNIFHCALDHMEADDVIATLTQKARKNNHFVRIVSSDKDLLQLLEEDHVTMIDTMRSKEFDVLEVRKKFGVLPRQVRFVQALAGDTSDNVPGVPGIGPKTGGELIDHFGDLENLLNRIDEVSGEKRREKLRKYADQARLSLQLVTLKGDCDIDFDIDKYRLQPPDARQVVELFGFLGFNQPLREIKTWVNSMGWAFEEDHVGEASDQMDLFSEGGVVSEESIEVAQDIKKNYTTIDTLEALDATFNDIKREIAASQWVSFDLETTSLNTMEAKIVGFAFSWQDHQGVYIPVGHSDLMAKQLPLEEVLQRFQPLFEDENRHFVVQNGKYEWGVLQNYDIEFRSILWDTMLMSYILDPDERHGLDAMALKYFDYQMLSFEEVAGKGKGQVTFDHVDVETATRYAAEDADLTRLIAKKLAQQLKGKSLKLYQTIELPLERVLANMERTGILIDREIMLTLSSEFEEEMAQLQQEIDKMAGCALNPNSTKQLREVLFEKLELPVKKRTKTGASTDASVLEQLALLHPLPQYILDYRSVSKLKSTYVDALPGLVQRDHRLHTDFNQTVAATGRLSSSNPNLQNIPIRSERGQSIRRAFIAAPGSTLICADYSQIELRIMAHMSEDPKLLHAYQNDIDIHNLTASQVFGIPMQEVTKEQRRAAKTINFGIMYGMGPNLLARQLKITTTEAKSYIEAYFKQYEGVEAFFKTLVQRAKETGYAETLFGRRRPIPNIHGKGQQLAFAERVAVNSPIQGTSADIIKCAMVELQSKIEKLGEPIRLLLQVHDELVLEAHEEIVERGKIMVKKTMESVVELKVPLVVEVGTGPNWLDAK